MLTQGSDLEPGGQKLMLETSKMGRGPNLDPNIWQCASQEPSGSIKLGFIGFGSGPAIRFIGLSIGIPQLFSIPDIRWYINITFHDFSCGTE